MADSMHDAGKATGDAISEGASEYKWEKPEILHFLFDFQFFLGFFEVLGLL